MDLQLKGKHVLITGASKGIGLEIAMSFCREGCDVTINGRDQKLLAVAANKLLDATGIQVKTVAADLSNTAGIATLVEAAGSIDILINNAGAIPGGDLFALDDATWRRAWDLKLFGYIDMVRQCLPAMQKRGSGVIFNVIGMAGSVPRAGYICGSVANAALIAFTKAMGAASTEHGVRILGLNPSQTRTDRIETLMRVQAEKQLGDSNKWFDLTQKLAFGRLAEPQEIADLVVFASSARASYLSGTVIDVDGGMQYRDARG
jgi:NAD(P)-dependent dehydrogenase (short-subunit alcohol dehydrogenase family)